jgi:ADP-heptose:LPS heptosyltransferase
MARLTIYDRRERALVAATDALLSPVALRRAFRRQPTKLPQRILCFRLERIGDLLMTGQALAELRALAPPGATIDLAVGSWNREIAAAIPGIDRVETLDAAWLSRDGTGSSALGLARQAARWRSRRYDLAINFEPDIRTNVALAAAGARRSAGFASGGGGPLLDVAIDYDASAHTIDNARRLVHEVFGGGPAAPVTWALRVPEGHRAAAIRLLAPFAGGPKVGMHVSGGRAIKQWPETRFRDVAGHLVAHRSAASCSPAPPDRAQIDIVRSVLPRTACSTSPGMSTC